MTTILALCKCIIRRLDQVLGNQTQILENQAWLAKALDVAAATIIDQGVELAKVAARIDAAVEEPQPEAAGFKLTLSTKE